MNYQAKGLCAAKLLIFCLLIGSQGTLGGVLYAQKSRVHRYSVKQGLPSSHTYCVALDTKGNIWAGTESGVVRFDGFTFNSYNQTAGLPQNDVFFIVDDQQ
ncbi:MAG TPA: hypothetical protein ENJ82_08715, partial [Bacteroidetes bacterium]|nr:hypothetical protein [Bacteroidota bacterium]